LKFVAAVGATFSGHGVYNGTCTIG